MKFIRILSVILSFMLIAAHFQRAGSSLLAMTCLFCPNLLFIGRPWSSRIVQILLLLATIEWLRTVVDLVLLRQDAGLPWLRLAIIIGGVLVFTLISALTIPNLRTINPDQKDIT